MRTIHVTGYQRISASRKVLRLQSLMAASKDAGTEVGGQ